MTPDTVQINKAMLARLVRRSLELQAMEAAGVDNWQGYCDVEWPTDEQVGEDLSLLIIQQ